MRCELCGKEAGDPKPVFVEGTKLNVCPACTRFGDKFSGGSSTSTTSRSVIEERLEKRKRRMSSRDVFSGDNEELVLDYRERIRGARDRLGWDQDKLASEIKEKKSIIAKMEAGDITPPEGLVKKIEKALNITLKEKVLAGGEVKGSGGRGLTLGDFIKKE